MNKFVFLVGLLLSGKTYQDWTFGMYRCLKSDIEKARLKTK